MIRYLVKTKYNPSLCTFFNNKFYISVYEGISPALLATMSLSQGIKGNSNEQLINSLLKSNIISNKVLQKSMKKYDRKLFISQDNKKIKNYYENKPYKISGGQNMTDIFTHAVTLQQTCYHIQQKLTKYPKQNGQKFKVLDVGSGHGYLSFVISAFLNEVLKQYKIQHLVIGIDSNKKAIQYSQSLKNKLLANQQYKQAKHIQFKIEQLQSIIKSPQNYDVIIGGFYMPPSLHQGLVGKLKNSANTTKRQIFGVWAADSNSGQSLYSFHVALDDKNAQAEHKLKKNQIMSTMFSMPTVKTSVSKYFVGQNQSNTDQENNQQQNSSPQSEIQVVNQQQIRQDLKNLKLQKRKAEKQKVKQQLKQTIAKYSTKINKKISLQEMKKIKQINDLLQKLNRL